MEPVSPKRADGLNYNVWHYGLDRFERSALSGTEAFWTLRTIEMWADGVIRYLERLRKMTVEIAIGSLSELPVQEFLDPKPGRAGVI